MTFNKATMIMEICSDLKIKYLSSMYNMSYKEVTQLYNAYFQDKESDKSGN